MNTITPLMRAMMEALDTAPRQQSEHELTQLIARKGFAAPYHKANRALSLLAYEGLVEHALILNYGVSEPFYKLTDAGCDALWALQKADAVSATFVGVDTASGPDKGIRVTFANGAMIDFVDTNHAPLTGYPNPVRDHDAHNPARDGDLLWQPGQPRVDDGVRPVRFNSRDELRAYTAGANA